MSNQINGLELEGVIASTQLTEISQTLFAKINAIPHVLQPGEQTIKEGQIIYNYVPTKRQKFEPDTTHDFNSGMLRRSQCWSSLEMPFIKEPETYDAQTRAKYFPETISAVEKVSGVLNTAQLNTALNPTTIYCTKTGAPIGEISQNALIAAVKAIGREKLQYALYNGHFSSVSLHWLNTSPEKLDELINSDTKGYAVYALNLLTGHYLNGKHPENGIEFYWSLARSYQLISLLSDNALDDLNDNLCGVLTYCPETSTFLRYRMAQRLGIKHKEIVFPDRLAREAVNGSLIDLLRDAADYALAAMGRMHQGTKKYSDVPRTPKDMAKGPSQIRGQNRSKIRVAVDQDILAFDAEFKAEISAMAITSKDEVLLQKAREGKLRRAQAVQTWREKLQAAKTPQTPDDFSDLDNFDLSSLNEETPLDDDTVEMRVIPRALLSGNEVKRSEAELSPEPQETNEPKLTLRERMKAQYAVAKPAPKKFNMRAKFDEKKGE